MGTPSVRHATWAVGQPPTQLAEGEAWAGRRGEAGAGGEGRVTGRLLQPAGGVWTQPITALLVATQLLLRRPISTKRKERDTIKKKSFFSHSFNINILYWKVFLTLLVQKRFFLWSRVKDSEWSPRLKHRIAAAAKTHSETGVWKRRRSHIFIISLEKPAVCAMRPEVMKHKHTTVRQCWRRQKTNEPKTKKVKASFRSESRASIKLKMMMKVQQIKTLAIKDEHRCGDLGCAATTVTSVPESLLRQSVSAAGQPAAEERHLRRGKDGEPMTEEHLQKIHSEPKIIYSHIS